MTEPALDQLADDKDELDGCDIDFAEDAVDDETLPYVVLGDSPEKVEEYKKLFEGAKDG